MRESFEIRSFPDLSLPRYYDLFGEQALSVAATRLFGWFQMVACSSLRFSFTVRYYFDPSRPSNQRLRIFVVVNTFDEVSRSYAAIGQQLAGSTLDLIEKVALPEIPHSGKQSWNLAVLSRQARLITVPERILLPAIWTRDVAARNAMEPYLDETFATLTDPAFLDIQLYAAADARNAREALKAAIANIEYNKQADGTGPLRQDYIERYKAIYESIASDPVSHLLICAGSPGLNVAEGLLQAFGIDTVGGGKFIVESVAKSSDQHRRLGKALEEGTYDFASPDGWFKSSLPEMLQKRGVALSAPQAQLLKDLSQLYVLAGRSVIQEVLTLPVPRRGFLRTFPLETELEKNHGTTETQRDAGTIVLGQDQERSSQSCYPLSRLTRHAFIAGVTGSGKTVTMRNILLQFAALNVPFIVFEPAKSEYRTLIRSAEMRNTLRVYTPGVDTLSPFRINPFRFESHITLSEHIANLTAAFSCALSLFTPLPSIVEDAIWRLYEENGWCEDSLGDTNLALPRFADLWPAVERTLNTVGYGAEVTGNFKGALRARLVPMTRGSIGRIFDCTESLPGIDLLCKSSAVIELQRLTQHQANLLMMFVMVAIREHLRNKPSDGDRPSVVLVLEEAHNLVPAVPDVISESSESGARAESSRFISGMLAEMRALGLSMFIVDQTPAAVSQQVLRNTNLKIAHRTVAKQDRETLADAMLMDPSRCELLGRLTPGDAYVYSDRYFRPHLLRVPYVDLSSPSTAKKKQVLTPVPDDNEIRQWLCSTKWFKESAEKRLEALSAQIAGLAARAIESDVYATGYLNIIDSLGQKEVLNEEISQEILTTQQAVNTFATMEIEAIENRLRNYEVEYRALQGLQGAIKLPDIDASFWQVINLVLTKFRTVVDHIMNNKGE